MSGITKAHSFHIPVMGIAFTLDSPLKVAPYGIDSVISLIDDILMEKMRKMYCEKFGLLYREISDKVEDFRAKRITSYLNLINRLANEKFESLKASAFEKGADFRKYLEMLPSGSTLKQKMTVLLQQNNLAGLRQTLDEELVMGSIDVNIMTKVDRENYRGDEKLPAEFNDAHAALRAYANSDLCSSLVLSAGMNPRLYSYLEQFEAFYPDENGELKKKIALKVSDYRSAFIQGKFLAAKGLWVSEYRIESGLNCGGHAFATDGYLMGPILAEFRDKKEELTQTLHDIWVKALLEKERSIPQQDLEVKITAQGGVGTGEEHRFLLDHYQLDSVGWGTPFLLVPEATTVDNDTLQRLAGAVEEDLYVSNISPLGVPFNTLRGNTKDEEKLRLLQKGRPGSSCPKKYIALNKEFTEQSICTASRQYQHLKIKELKTKELAEEKYQSEYNKIVEKACICVGLGTSALLVNDLDTKTEGPGVSVCPGPNLAYFSRTMTLEEITGHIYDRSNVITRTDRPNMFVKEMNMYLDFLKGKMQEISDIPSKKETKYLSTFITNMEAGIQYYMGMFGDLKNFFEESRADVMKQLDYCAESLQLLKLELENISRDLVLAE